MTPVESPALDPSESLTPGLRLNKTSFTRPRIPLVAIFRGLSAGALAAVFCCISLGALVTVSRGLSPGALVVVSSSLFLDALVTVSCGLPLDALKDVPSFSFRFLSERLLGSGDGGVESLTRGKLFN